MIRRLRNTLFAATAGAVLLASALAPSQAATWEPVGGGPGTYSITLTDAFIGELSEIRIGKPTGPSSGTSDSFCNGFGTAPCDAATASQLRYDYYAMLMLPMCSTGLSEYCIETVEFGLDQGPMAAGQYLGAAPGPVVKAQPEFGLPYGGGSALFSAPGFPNAAGSSTYMVQAVLGLSFKRETGSFQPVDFSLAVLPYSTESRTGSAPKLVAIDSRSFPTPVVPGTVRQPNEWVMEGVDGFAAWWGDGNRGPIEDFPSGTRVGVSVHLPSSLGGWFSGRLRNPAVALSAISASVNRLQVTADAVTVPRVSVSALPANFTPMMIENHASANTGTFTGTEGDHSMRWVEDLRKLAQDKAAGQNTLWAIKNVPVFGNSCYRNDSVMGLVTTNAMTYAGGAPTFANGMLDYRVAGMHYNANGSVAQGTYDLVMRSDVARCLYGFSSAPVEASISVLSASGAESVATKVVNEQDGWLHLGAYGFTFSSPTVRVILSQAKPASTTTATPSPSPSATKASPTPTATLTPTPTPTPTPSASKTAAAKVRTITCVRATPKRTITVKGVAPKCPTGYKQR